MKRIFLLFAIVFTRLHVHSQVDSFLILGLPFHVVTPEGWKLNQIDTGICHKGDYNAIIGKIVEL